MRILLITRVYSALVSSILTNTWPPKGSPAYYKLLEVLGRKYDVEAVCLSKGPHDGIGGKDRLLRFPENNTDFHIVPYILIKLIGRHLNRMVNDILQCFYCLRLVFKGKYDLIYVDRENVALGAIFAVLGKKVVLRMLGVGYLIKRFAGWRKLKDPIGYLNFKASFRYIICSKDGSGGRYFKSRYVNRKVPFEILLNGVDIIRDDQTGNKNKFLREKYDIPENHKIILFVGRLSLDKKSGYDKGICVYIEVLAELRKRDGNFFAVIVGDGYLRKELEDRVSKKGMSDYVKFESGVLHNSIYNYFCSADIYVSLNSLGNLSNTVLEAVNAGLCVVTYKKDDHDHTDEDTEEILKGRAILIDKNRVSEELPDALDALLKNEDMIRDFSSKTKELTLLKSWGERIDYEAEILKKIAFGR